MSFSALNAYPVLLRHLQSISPDWCVKTGETFDPSLFSDADALFLAAAGFGRAELLLLVRDECGDHCELNYPGDDEPVSQDAGLHPDLLVFDAGTQAGVARACKVAPSTVSRWIKSGAVMKRPDGTFATTDATVKSQFAAANKPRSISQTSDVVDPGNILPDAE